jgi:hypothetical protein
MIRRRRVAAAAAVIAVAAGGGVAIAATTASSPQEREQAVLADAADRLGVSPGRLRDALAAAEDSQLDAAVTAGDLTQEQADAIKAMRQRFGLVLGGTGAAGGPRIFGFGGRHHGFRGPESGAAGAACDAVAKALGLDREALFAQLREGKTLAEVAQDRNVAVDDVRAGRLTQARADALQDRIVERIDRFPGPAVRPPSVASRRRAGAAPPARRGHAPPLGRRS